MAIGINFTLAFFAGAKAFSVPWLTSLGHPFWDDLLTREESHIPAYTHIYTGRIPLGLLNPGYNATLYMNSVE